MASSAAPCSMGSPVCSTSRPTPQTGLQLATAITITAETHRHSMRSFRGCFMRLSVSSSIGTSGLGFHRVGNGVPYRGGLLGRGGAGHRLPALHGGATGNKADAAEGQDTDDDLVHLIGLGWLWLVGSGLMIVLAPFRAGQSKSRPSFVRCGGGGFLGTLGQGSVGSNERSGKQDRSD